MKTARFITIKELEEYGRNVPYSLLECVDCGRWRDISDKKTIPEWKLESEMNKDELMILSDNRKEIENGRGRGLSTCRYCKEKYLTASNLNWYKVAATREENRMLNQRIEKIINLFIQHGYAEDIYADFKNKMLIGKIKEKYESKIMDFMTNTLPINEHVNLSVIRAPLIPRLLRKKHHQYKKIKNRNFSNYMSEIKEILPEDIPPEDLKEFEALYRSGESMKNFKLKWKKYSYEVYLRVLIPLLKQKLGDAEFDAITKYRDGIRFERQYGRYSLTEIQIELMALKFKNLVPFDALSTIFHKNYPEIKSILIERLGEDEFNRINQQRKYKMKLKRKQFNQNNNSKFMAKDYHRVRNELASDIIKGYYGDGKTAEEIAIQYNIDIQVLVRFLEEAEKDPFLSNDIKKIKGNKIANIKNWYKVAKEDKTPLTQKERDLVKSTFGDNLECSFARDKDGYYCYTHRARSSSYPSIDKIPKSKVEFVGSTG